jgi:hypothetical protein
MTRVKNPAIWDHTRDYEPFTSNELGIPLIDTLFTQYLSSLGQFPFLGDGIIPMYNPWIQLEIWTLMFFATLFVTMLFINTLISVIGAEYSDLWDNKIRYGLMETARLYADHCDDI